MGAPTEKGGAHPQLRPGIVWVPLHKTPREPLLRALGLVSALRPTRSSKSTAPLTTAVWAYCLPVPRRRKGFRADLRAQVAAAASVVLTQRPEQRLPVCEARQTAGTMCYVTDELTVCRGCPLRPLLPHTRLRLILCSGQPPRFRMTVLRPKPPTAIAPWTIVAAMQ